LKFLVTFTSRKSLLYSDLQSPDKSGQIRPS
jgi:hypothetical protein